MGIIKNKRRYLLGILTWMILGVGGVDAQLPQTDLTKLSLEELMQIQVTSAARTEQRLSAVAAAMYVITQEEIRRSGATSIPEVLRLVPGLHVARIDSNKWAISARGFNTNFSNKVLVLVDGRSVYSPLFSGVFWGVQDTVLEDIDRIEVIRGPAGTLWGANAGNGVINIITKKAEDTQGGLLSAGGGSEDRGFGELRYGGQFGSDTYYRVYGKYFSRDNFSSASGSRANDAWHFGRGGFRIDSDIGASDSVTVQGDYYDGKTGIKVLKASLTAPLQALAFEDAPNSGGHLLGRWKRRLAENSDLTLQFYYDRSDRDFAVGTAIRNTLDFEAQHSFAPAPGTRVVWGVGYRFVNEKVKNSFTIAFSPTRRNDQLFSAFVQGEFPLIKDRLRMLVGSKVEHNDYSGIEIQPNVRLTWMVNEANTFWAAISRAVRTPSRFEQDSRGNVEAVVGPTADCPVLGTCLVSFFGRKGFRSEKLIAYELGYRSQINKRFSVDIAAFYNVYDDLRTSELGTPFFESNPLPPHLVIPLRAANKMDAESFGVELSTKWNPTDFWKLALGYTFLKTYFHFDKSSTRVHDTTSEGDSPEHQFRLSSYLNLPYNVTFDTSLHFIDRLKNLKTSSYTKVDLRLGYSPIKSLDFSIGVQNLFGPPHREFGADPFSIPTKVERNIYGKITWRF